MATVAAVMTTTKAVQQVDTSQAAACCSGCTQATMGQIATRRSRTMLHSPCLNPLPPTAMSFGVLGLCVLQQAMPTTGHAPISGSPPVAWQARWNSSMGRICPTGCIFYTLMCKMPSCSVNPGVNLLTFLFPSNLCTHYSMRCSLQTNLGL